MDTPYDLESPAPSSDPTPPSHTTSQQQDDVDKPTPVPPKRGPGRPRKQPAAVPVSTHVSFAPTPTAPLGYSFSQDELQKFLMKQKIKKYAKKYVLKQQAKYQAPLYPDPRTPYPSEDEDEIEENVDESEPEEEDEKEEHAPPVTSRPPYHRAPAYANPPRGSKLAQILGYR
jgi:hypothetical protein